MRQIITKPFITEKSLQMAQAGSYTFAVAPSARKRSIAVAISRLYKVEVVDVHTVSMHGKVRRVGKRRIETPKPDWKKAIVRLKSGQSIDAFQVTGDSGSKK